MTFALGVGRQIIEEFAEPGTVRFVYRHFPVLGPASVQAGEATECAAEQDLFWPYHDGLYVFSSQVGQSAFAIDGLELVANGIGADMASWTTCMQSDRNLARVRQDIAAGEELGVNSTPTIYINGLRTRDLASIEDFRGAIDAELDRVNEGS
jgi:protein-disulfide isomerase